MKPVIYVTADHQFKRGQLMQAGFARHGISAEIVKSYPTEAVDLLVCWGHRHQPLFDKQLKAGRRYLVMERGYIGDRFLWTSLGFDGLNGRADFCNKLCDGARWPMLQKYQVNRSSFSGTYCLLVGQVPGDAALRGRDLKDWYTTMAAQLSFVFNLPVYFRRHPGAMEKGYQQYVTHTELENPGTPIETSLDGAHVVCTYNSNVAVDAVLAGVPRVISFDEGSMAYEVTEHAITLQQSNPECREYPVFTNWCRSMSYTQWLPQEIADGTAWAHLKQGVSL